jgi:hypothetical protein
MSSRIRSSSSAIPLAYVGPVPRRARPPAHVGTRVLDHDLVDDFTGSFPRFDIRPTAETRRTPHDWSDLHMVDEVPVIVTVVRFGPRNLG